MQVGTGKSILNGIAIGKLKIYKKKDTVISAAEVADTAAEAARFEDARAKAIDQQTALYEKALAEAGEDIAEVFNIHAMMLDDDDFVDAIKEIINGQRRKRIAAGSGRSVQEVNQLLKQWGEMNKMMSKMRAATQGGSKKQRRQMQSMMRNMGMGGGMPGGMGGRGWGM